MQFYFYYYVKKYIWCQTWDSKIDEEEKNACEYPTTKTKNGGRSKKA